MAASMLLRQLCSRTRQGSVLGNVASLHRSGNKSRCLSSEQLFIEKFGDPKDVVNMRTVDLPALDSRQVLVKMMMAPVNPSDINMIEGTYFIQPPLPAAVGNEGVGQVVDTGEEVKGLSVGDWVIPRDTAWGTWQTYNVSHDENLIKLPNDIPVLSAATISVNPCTAYRMLKDFVDLNEGDVVIQNGGNSGVGVSVIQLAREWNFKTINIVRSRTDFETLKEYLHSLGADYVVTEEFARTPEMNELLKGLGRKPKLAFNCVGGSSSTELLRRLGQGGVMVTYGGMSKKPIVVPTGALLFKELKLCGYWNTEWNQKHSESLRRFEMLSDLCRLMKESKFVPPPCDVFPLKNYKAAIEQAMEGYKGTKKVLKMD